ncbi:hypothetical protein ACFWA9_16360 [Kitasatospora sp. NPDC059973]|uniref:hypothetical protein n=1 Tax=Kitasatospora sp. NPDC059973 TaxID=3347020 RepID=UPI003692CC03
MSHPRPLLALTAAAVATVLTLGAAGIATGSAAPSAVTIRAAAPAGQLPTADQLKAALLSNTELGPNFSEVPVADSPTAAGGASPVAGCDALRALLNGNESGPSSQLPHQEIEFDGPDGNPMLTESLTAEDATQLTSDLTVVSDAFTDCHSLTFNDGTDASVTFTVTPVTLGDRKDAPAVRLDGTLAGVPLSGYLAVERFGTVALSYGFYQRDDPSSQLASLYYRAAVAKAERTLGTPAGTATAPPASV